jgi:leader peptidase (prepilin peptidase)/N-methyltransferase
MFVPLEAAVLGAFLGYTSLWLFVKLFYLLTGKEGMGEGDFKLFSALGAWLGWQLLPLIILFSSLCGAIIGIIILNVTHKNKDTPLPFGPYLCLGGFIALIWGHSIIDWYLSSFLN